jgi:large subunit ribosomal protein L3
MTAGMIGFVGKKMGMTQIFDDEGCVVPVTVIAGINRVTQIKTKATDGYTAIQVAAGAVRANQVSKPAAGHFAKAKVEAGSVLKEFRLDNEDCISLDQHASEVAEEDGKLRIGSEIKVNIFEVGQIVDVTAVTKGKGFAGTIKRHHFKMQDASHGNSKSHRAPGSIGQNQTPRKVFKGKKMAGHLGDVRRTIQNQKVVAVDDARNLLMIKGVVPGAQQATVVVTFAAKKSQKTNEGKE